MTTILTGGSRCNGVSCSPPKECCDSGCCFLSTPPLYRPTTIQATAFNPLFLGHWYFWLAVTATVTGILCVCSFWRKHSQGGLCCRDSGRDERASEPDSNGSCYAPPQYSRCNSFYQAPPPYSEVTSKPDRYPVVISYDVEPAAKTNGSTGYLMVQYFRKLIVGPVGDRSLSATSTIDSINSSFLCNVAIEANTIVPPPYSSTGSLDDLASDKPWKPPEPNQIVQYSAQLDEIGVDAQQTTSSNSNASVSSAYMSERENLTPNHQLPSQNPEHEASKKAIVPKEQDRIVNKNQTICDGSPAHKNSTKKLLKERSSDSESQDDAHNFSDLLNLSVCVPSNVAYLKTPIHSNALLQELHYSVTNSMTGSDVSSLANLDTPESPPRATSPTLEMKELLNKIQKLPQPLRSQENRPSRNYFHKMRAKTLYMPLSGTSSHKTKNLPNVSSKSWLSRSAPNTPCTSYVPIFPNYKGAVTDGSPLLLMEGDDTEEETTPNKDECL